MSKKKSKRKSKDLKMDKLLSQKLVDEFGEEQQRFGNEIITKENVAEANLEYQKLFGANKNLYRVIASLQDGMKPGKRRMFYTWWLMEGRPQNTKRETLNKLHSLKVATIISQTLRLHPHGESGIEETLSREGQYWSNNIMTVVPQGSYGNMRGDRAAAGRYLESKLSEFTIDCFFSDFDKYCVPMKVGYDGVTLEPEFLPAKYPFILFNPQFSGIGYGNSSNIFGSNVTEVLDATIKLIKDPSAKILLIPDSPTGCDIIDEGLFKEMNKTGIGKVTMRATSEIDYVKNVIKITTLPYNGASKDVVLKIIDLINKGTIKDIAEIQDSTKEGEVDIKIFLKSSAQPDKVLDTLYKKGTGLKAVFPIGITVIEDYEEFEYGVKELLLAWIDYRIDIVRSMFLNSLQQVETDAHMNEVLLMVFNKDNIDTTIKIAKESKTKAETISKYMKKFGITSLQAEVIANMHVYNFNADQYEKYKERAKELKEELKYINSILDDESKLEQFIIDQLEEGKKKWGSPRRSKIVKESDDNIKDIPDTEHLIGISETGFIKKLPLKKASSIGSVGKTNSNLYVFSVNNRENLLVVDSTGMVSKISISAIPNMEFEEIGIELSKFFTVKGHVKAVMELPTMDLLSVDDESLGIILISKKGICKKVKLSEFANITDKKLAMGLNDGDEVASALFAVDKAMKDIIICTNLGNGIRLPLTEIRTYGMTAKGLQMITLKDDEEVVSASLINPKKKLLFYVTTNGRAKITELKFFPAMDRKDKALNLIALQGDEKLVGVGSCDKNDMVMIYKKKSEPETIEIKSFEPKTRVAKGDKVIKTTRGESVIDFRIFSSK